jgi:hypothetical protein
MEIGDAQVFLDVEPIEDPVPANVEPVEPDSERLEPAAAPDGRA